MLFNFYLGVSPAPNADNWLIWELIVQYCSMLSIENIPTICLKQQIHSQKIVTKFLKVHVTAL